MQADEPAPEKVPSKHGKHWSELISAYVPGAHDCGQEDPAAHDAPYGQVVQKDLSLEGEKLPLSHGTHAAALSPE